MQSNTKCFLPNRHWKFSIQGQGLVTRTVRTICLNLVLFGIVLAFSMIITAETFASDQPEIGSYQNLDARWRPWIGSWRLISNTFNTSESVLNEEYLLTVNPGDKGKSIVMKGYRDNLILSEEKIITDGLQQPLTDDRCTGWYSYSWSETGKRLLFNSESSCQDNLPRAISGMSFIDDAGEWLDIQLLKSGKEKAVTIRRYRNVDNGTVTLDRINATQARMSRISAGTKFSISEIIELSSKVEPEVLEVALMEVRKPFPINSKQLVRLADARVPSRIVDLMVALSFPDKFKVERTAISPVQAAEPPQAHPYPPPPYRYWSYDHPLYPWYWESSFYSPYYDYWYLGWYGWPGWYYRSWWYPNYGGEDKINDAGRLVEGRGYTRVSPISSGSSSRYAQPRNAPQRQEAVGRPASSSFSGMSSSGYSAGSSSGSSSRSSSGSSSKSPCASPGGYSSGNCD